MGPELGLVVLLPALLFGLTTVGLTAREETRQQQAAPQATSSNKPI